MLVEPDFIEITIKIKYARNDAIIGNFNRPIFAGWRGNMDISFIENWYQLKCYLSKYISKHETWSPQMKEIIKEINESKYD